MTRTLAATAALGAWLLFFALQGPGVAGPPGQRPERPSEGGRRGVDPQTGEPYREPTARDDLDQRLPIEFMPAAAEPVARTVDALTGEDEGRVLFDNGPLVDCAGCGAGGADESQLGDLTADRSTLGFGHQAAAGGRIADDFVIDDPDGWTVRDVLFFAYQTGSTSRSTVLSVDLKIWSGPPGVPGSRMIWDGGEALRLTDSRWSGLYRVGESATGATNRPVMTNTVAVNSTLAPGTYWLDWQTAGRLASGPWAPSLARTGNALQSLDGGGSWQPAVDAGSGEPVDFPFVIVGDSGMAGVGPKMVLRKYASLNRFDSCEPFLDPLTVSLGTEVSYCYFASNVGDTRFVHHTLVDDHLGPLFNDDFSLSPGERSTLNRTEITITGTIVANAVWTATTETGQEATAEDTSTVFVSTQRPLRCNDGVLDFQGGIPADWLAANRIVGSPIIWTSIAGCGEAANYAESSYDNGNLYAACASSDLQGGGAGLFDTDLISSSFGLTGVETAFLEFDVNYQNFLGQDRLEVGISTDNGVTWTPLATWSDDLGSFRALPGAPVALDLAAYVGEPNLRLRWRYYDHDDSVGQDDWYVEIDNIALDCTFPAGGFYACRQPDLAIPDFDPAGATDQMVLDASRGEIHDLDVALRVSHPLVGELSATLTHGGAGITETLFHLPGNPAAMFGCESPDIVAVIDDEGVDGDVESTCNSFSPAISGSLVPGDPPGSSPLSVFDQTPIGTVWTLSLADLSAGPTGTLEEWCLIGTACGSAITNRIFHAPETIEDCGVLQVGPNVFVNPLADPLTLRAAAGVNFVDNVRVFGDLAIELDPSLAPP